MPVMAPGEPEAFQELDDDELYQAWLAFHRKHGRWPDPDKGEGFEVAQALLEASNRSS